MDQNEHLQLGKLISRTSMHSFAKWYKSIRLWSNLFTQNQKNIILGIWKCKNWHQKTKPKEAADIILSASNKYTLFLWNAVPTSNLDGSKFWGPEKNSGLWCMFLNNGITFQPFGIRYPAQIFLISIEKLIGIKLLECSLNGKEILSTHLYILHQPQLP